MRSTLLFLSFFFISILCEAQKREINIERIHPVFKHDRNGDSIRKYFTSTHYSKGKSGLMICAFFSNKLEVNYRDLIKQVPQLTNYHNYQKGIYEVALNGTSGRNAIPIFDTSGVIITVNGINQKNVHEYEFRVLENRRKVVVPWTEPKLFDKVYWQSR
ncbi:MAG: hypothetical protein EOP48_07050, partial [Sphingobacteriales bacterium]